MNIAREMAGATNRRQKVILLEDEDLLRELFAGWIREGLPDADLAMFANGDEAWRELSRTRTDLLITDELHPGMLGAKIIGRLAAAGVKCSILWISGGADFRLPSLDDRPGIKVEFLPKPFFKEQFQNKLTRLTREEQS